MPAWSTRVQWFKLKNIKTKGEQLGKPGPNGTRRGNETWKELKRGRRRVKMDENDKNPTSSRTWAERVAKKNVEIEPRKEDHTERRNRETRDVRNEPEEKRKRNDGIRKSDEVELKLKGGMEKNEMIREQLVGVKSNSLKNLGNACYMNSVLLCLARCKRLKKAMNRGKTVSGVENRVVTQIREALDEAAKTSKEKPWKPKDLWEELMTWSGCSEWKKGEQQDAGELLTVIIDKLRAEKSEAGKLFLGEHQSLTTCKNVGVTG